MGSKANINIAGFIASEPQLKEIPAQGGSFPALEFSVPVQAGSDAPTNWYRVTVIGKAATALSAFLAKGMAVSVNGTLNVRDYEKSDGSNGYSLDVRATDATVLSKRGEVEAAPVALAATAAKSPAPSRSNAVAGRAVSYGYGKSAANPDDLPF